MNAKEKSLFARNSGLLLEIFSGRSLILLSAVLNIALQTKNLLYEFYFVIFDECP